MGECSDRLGPRVRVKIHPKEEGWRGWRGWRVGRGRMCEIGERRRESETRTIAT